MIPTLVAITMITYVIMRMAPGDPTRSSFIGSGQEQALSAEKKESKVGEMLRKKYYLDRNPIVGYFFWLNDVLHGDLGDSIVFDKGTPVAGIIAVHLPVTLKLNVIGIMIIYLLAVPIGVISAVKRNSFVDRSLTVVVFGLWSLPVFWLAPILMAVFCLMLGWFPSHGISPSMAEARGHSSWLFLMKTASFYVLPVVCGTYGGFAGLSRFMRTGLLEVIRQDYIRTARAKGLSERVVVFKHALRNALIPIVTLLAGLLPGLVAGSFVIEMIFSIPGMGYLGMSALSSRDYPLIMANLLFGTMLMLTGILISDIMYRIVDPRISFERSHR